MPALEVLGRKWHIASDDLPLPSLCGALWHAAWLPVIAVNLDYVVNQLSLSCTYRIDQVAYLATHVACFAINAVLHAWTFFESRRGSMFQMHCRRRVGPLVVSVCIFYALTIGNNLYGSWLVYYSHTVEKCPGQPGRLSLNHVAMIQATVIVTWVSLGVGCLAMFITFNLLPSYEVATRWLCCKSRKKRPLGRTSVGEGMEGLPTEGTHGMTPMMVIVKVFTEIFGGADMTVSDHLAALMLVGVRHRHVKLAHTYSNVPPPAWLYDGLMGPVGSVPVTLGAVGFGQTASMRPPVVVELTASDRPLNGACSTSDPASTADAAAPDPGTGNPTTALASTTTSQPRAAAAGPTNLAPATPGLGSDAVTSPSTADATHDTGATAHNGNGSSGNGNGHALQQTAFTRGLTGQESGKALSAKSTGLGPPDSAKLSEGTASGEMAPGRKLTAVTSKVFGRALVMPNGRVPVLLDPLREWDGQTAEPNADLPVMEEALHYMKYATAVYGWMMYLWINRLHVTSWCRLCTGRGCGCCRQSKYFLHAGGSDVGPPEGCCTASKLLEREAITQLTGVADVDILYVCYDNQVSGILPYFIALDRSRSSVVIGIRGSMSLRDVVTDLLCVPAPYDVPGVPSTDASGKRDMWGHSGMVQCMRAILADVERQGVLEAALGEWPAEAAQQAAALQRLPSERARAVARRLAGGCRGWRLVITGHSLGAGVAGLLGPVLRVRYPNLRCWAFAPPGGLMSPKAAELTREFCISVVNAKDMVPRLGMTQMEHLVQEMVTASAHCRVPKFSVVWRMAVMGGSPDQADLFQAADELKQEPRSRLEEYLKYFETAKASSPLTETRAFVPPGHLLYVERHKVEASGARPCCSCNVCLVGRSGRQSNFSCRWISMEDFVSRGLVVSRSMFLDHTPDNTLMSIQQAYDQMLEARGLGPRPSQRYVPPWLRPTTPTSSPRLDKPVGAGSSNARAALGSTAPHSNSSAGATSFGVSTRNAVPEAAALSIVQEAGESQINVVSEAGGVVAGQGAATAPGRARDGAKEGPVGEEAA